MSRPTLRWSSLLPFVYGAITRYGRTFQTVSLSFVDWFNWAAPRSLATTCGISVDFFSSGY